MTADRSSLAVERWRKRPVDVDAVRFTGFGEHGNGFAVLAWIWEHGGQAEADSRELRIITLEGDRWVRPGDWVIRGVRGEFYASKPEVFEAAYDRVGS